MKRHGWLILSLVALFGLRAPLCVYACVAVGAQPATASTPPLSEAYASCHGDGRDGDAGAGPDAPAPTHHECDCGRVQMLVAKSQAKQAAGLSKMHAPSVAAAAVVLPAAHRRPIRAWKRFERLPPPDLLALNSTLRL